MITWPRLDVLKSCKTNAVLLPVIENLDPARLLAALAMNESSLGINCGPRHEPAWDVGGTYGSDPEQAKLLALWPYQAACSYGPWQVMYYNVAGYTPTELNTDLAMVTRATIGYLSRQIAHWKVTTVQEIGEMWNWGHPNIAHVVKDPTGVEIYCHNLAGNYIAAQGWLEGV
jgi:hypothetical protein